MIKKNNSQPDYPIELYNYLVSEIGLTKEAIELGIRQSKIEKAPIAIVLWNFGLISALQYKKIIEWTYNR